MGEALNQNRELLVALLREAAQIEHSLLCAYLYAAYTLKTMPEEFTVPGQENPRRALQFERVRDWKQSILMAAREEMRHVHYVQCLLRTLGERPCFVLPERNAAGCWAFSNWQERVFAKGEMQEEEVEIPLAALSRATAQRFVLFESGDWMQDAEPLGDRVTHLFDELCEFELQLRIEQMVQYVDDAKLADTLRTKLLALYRGGLVQGAGGGSGVGPSSSVAPETGELPRFTSITDLYMKGILPLFQEAFESGWVGINNFRLVTELQEATEGAVAVGPQLRTAKFSAVVNDDFSDPINSYEDVKKLLMEIVTEGEGVENFDQRAVDMMEHVTSMGGPGAFAKLVASNPAQPPDWYSDAMLLRNSHVYRFAIILRALEKEQFGSRTFVPARETAVVSQHIRLQELTRELPSQFNACYLVQVAWLERMYEVEFWNEDATRRRAIEQIATWPMMSMAIRPFLELSSFLPVDERQLFRTDAESMPVLPVFARQLLERVKAPQRTAAMLEEMDRLAVRVLGAVADWAHEMKHSLANEIQCLPEYARLGIMTRLNTLSHLKEFAEQFLFRVAGGYSNQLPQLAYQRNHPNGRAFSEDPFSLVDPATIPVGQTPPPTALFANTTVVRLRFSGWASLQMATDFDPPTDEAGCTGNVFLRASDGPGKRLDRALMFQATTHNGVILREPREHLPKIGVNVVDASLLVTKGQATAGYRAVTQPHAAITTKGQSFELAVNGLSDLCRLEAAEISPQPIQMSLQPTKETPAHLVGQNHLVWQNGEPIDPFVLAVQAEVPDLGPSELLFQRGVFNGGKSILAMSPLQRLYSARWMLGGTPNGTVPDWVPAAQRPEQDPQRFQKARVDALAQTLVQALDAVTPATEQSVDRAVSLAERIPAVFLRWLAAHTHYGHTISGDFGPEANSNAIYAAIEARTGAAVTLTTNVPRNTPNGRWLVEYNLASYDTDAMACLVYGELYVPVTVTPAGQPMQLQRRWSFPAGVAKPLASLACDFSKRMWGVPTNGTGIRYIPWRSLRLAEMLTTSNADSYSYMISGIDGVDSMTATFTVESTSAETALVWEIAMLASSAAGAVDALSYAGECMEDITGRLQQFFAPKL